ncbi:MAG TPA: MMPL family transporter [Streptosporangiaceae bacterium]|nr:MMPL family transporter [Streptosporangiaceae bacterium]
MDTKRPARAPIVERVAGWSAIHRKTAVFGWLLLVVVAVAVGHQLGTTSVNSYDPGESGRAERVLDRPVVQQPDAESVLVQGRSGPGTGQTYASDPEMRQAVREVVAALRALPKSAAGIESPLTSSGLTSGKSALVTFNVAGKPDNDDTAVVPALNAVAAVQAHHPGLKVEEAGGASVDRAIGSVTGNDFRKAEVTSIPVSLVLLLVVFGALIAAGIPLLLAGTAVISAISLLAIPGRWLPVDSTTSSIVLLVGMAVGIDYSLFYLRRTREERAAGRSTAEALRIAAHTSGRAIVVSGLTVMIALAGLFLTGIDVFTGVAIGTILVVGVAVLGSLTFLPAILSMLGPWTDRGRIPFLGRRRTAARESRFFGALARAVVRRPLIWGGVAAIALLAVAAPALRLNLEDPGIHSLPPDVPVVHSLADISQAFPGGPVPAEVVVTGADLGGKQVTRAIAALHGQVAGTHGAIREPISSAMFGHDQVLVVSVPLAGSGTDATSNNALMALRDHALPATLGKVPGISYAVTGLTAGNHDFDAQLAKTVPWVFVFVLGLAFLLLMASFRSVYIPALSIGLNLLSVGAAYGLMVLIFQDGHLEGPLGFTAYGGITAWLPLFMFVLLFGLSMDYHVFILSRIRELRLGGASARQAITGGIASSAGVVTSAAAIMVAVFSIFATLSLIEFKMFGVAMAAAVLIDATVVRGVLLPAGLALLGDRVWPRGRRGTQQAATAPAVAPPVTSGASARWDGGAGAR